MSKSEWHLDTLFLLYWALLLTCSGCYWYTATDILIYWYTAATAVISLQRSLLTYQSLQNLINDNKLLNINLSDRVVNCLWTCFWAWINDGFIFIGAIPSLTLVCGQSTSVLSQKCGWEHMVLGANVQNERKIIACHIEPLGIYFLCLCIQSHSKQVDNTEDKWAINFNLCSIFRTGLL